MESLQTILPVILSAVAIAFSVAQWVGGKGQRDATEASTLTDSAMGLVTTMRAEIKELRQEVWDYEKRIDEMGAAMLASQTEKNTIINALTARIEELEEAKREQGETIKENTITIQQQGALIMQLRDRVKSLESENVLLREENERLKAHTKRGRV